MAGRAVVRFGGLCGILYVAFLTPAYLVGYPDAPEAVTSPQEVLDYFGVGGRGTFLIGNGVLPLFCLFFFVVFLGILHAILRHAEGERRRFSSVALAGGATFAALMSAGLAVEISYPAAAYRFEGFQEDAQLVFLSLALSSWLYHFCQVGTAVLVAATSMIGLDTGILPGWLVWAGLVVALLALLHFLIPLLASAAGMLWVVVISALMLAGTLELQGGVRTSRRIVE